MVPSSVIFLTYLNAIYSYFTDFYRFSLDFFCDRKRQSCNSTLHPVMLYRQTVQVYKTIFTHLSLGLKLHKFPQNRSPENRGLYCPVLYVLFPDGSRIKILKRILPYPILTTSTTRLRRPNFKVHTSRTYRIRLASIYLV